VVEKQLRSNLGDVITVKRELCPNGAIQETVTVRWGGGPPPYEQVNPFAKQGVRRHYSARL
jgi:hypothetical protein